MVVMKVALLCKWVSIRSHPSGFPGQSQLHQKGIPVYFQDKTTKTGKSILLKTITYSPDIIFQPTESCMLDFRYQGVPLHLEFRLLWRSIHHRTSPEKYDHPAPPFSRLFLFQHGGAEVTVQKKKYQLHAGTIYLLPPRMPFTVAYTVSELVYLHIYFSDITGDTLFPPERGILQLDNCQFFTALSEACRQNDTFSLQAGLIDVVAALLADDLDRIAARGHDAEEFSLLFEWLKQQPIASITVHDAARLYNITPGAFSKRFRRTMGTPFKDYLTQLQLRQAQYQLMYTDKQVQQIAAELGFTCSQYFHRFFRRHCNCTPTEYRKQSRSH